MNGVENKCKLPRVVPIQQKFAIDSIKDITAAMTNELEKPEVLSQCKPGMRAAIAVEVEELADSMRLYELVNNLKHPASNRSSFHLWVVTEGLRLRGSRSLAGYNITEELVGRQLDLLWK